MGVIDHRLLPENLGERLFILSPHLSDILFDFGDTQEAIKVFDAGTLARLDVVNRMVHLHVFLPNLQKSLDIHEIPVEDVSEEAFANLSVFDAALVLLAAQQREEVGLAYLLIVVHVVEVECKHL